MHNIHYTWMTSFTTTTAFAISALSFDKCFFFLVRTPFYSTPKLIFLPDNDINPYFRIKTDKENVEKIKYLCRCARHHFL